MLNLLKKNTWFVLGLLAAFAAGGALMIGILYDKPGRRVVEKVNELAGFRVNHTSYYAYGYGKPVHANWSAVHSPTLPEWNVQKGFDVELVAEGLDYPVNMVFVPKPGDDPDSPVFYVNELHGR